MIDTQPRFAAPWMAASSSELVGVHVGAALEAQLHGLDVVRLASACSVCAGIQLMPAAAISAVDPCAVAMFGIGAVLQQQAHHLDVARQRGADERRLPVEVRPTSHRTASARAPASCRSCRLGSRPSRAAP